MKDLVIDIEAEKNEIVKRYRALLRASKSTLQKGDKRMIRKAFDMIWIITPETIKVLTWDLTDTSGPPYVCTETSSEIAMHFSDYDRISTSFI